MHIQDYFNQPTKQTNKPKKIYLCIVYVYMLYMQVPTCMQVSTEPQEGTGYPSAEITGGCGLPCWCWEQNMGFLLTAGAISVALIKIVLNSSWIVPK